MACDVAVPFRDLVHAGTDPVAWLSRDGVVAYLNPAGCALLGLDEGPSAVGRTIAEIHPAWALDLLETVGLPTALEKGSWSGKSALRHADGSEIPVMQSLVAHGRGDGRPTHLSMVCHDLRPFVQEMPDSHEADRRFRAFVHASPMGIHSYELRSDDRLVFVGANPGADRILGVDNSQFVGKTIEEAFPPLAATEIPRRYREAAKTGRLWRTEHVEYDHGNIKGAFEVYAFQTAPNAMAAMFLDITERKQAEVARDRLEERLRQATKMEAVGRLAGGVAHDFNNILTAILGNAEQLELSLAEGDPRGHSVREILDAAERAGRLTRQLLSFARKQHTTPKVVDVNRIIREARRMLARIIGEDVRLDFRPGAALWPVRIDPSQLEQVLVNLVVNSRDAMPEGGGLTIETVNIETPHGDPDPALEEGGPDGGAHTRRAVGLTVRDTGHGMSPEVLEHAFEPFFSTKEVGKGTGLGLATVYGIVEQAGGRIQVESLRGRGTQVRIELPAVEQPCEEPHAATGLDVGGTETVLVVEDDARVRELCQSLLERQGYRVLAADGGASALSLARSLPDPVDLLLTDVVMPGIHGRALYRELRALWPALRVLFMSGFDEEAVARRGVPEVSSSLLQKPFTLATLSAKVREVLDEA